MMAIAMAATPEPIPFWFLRHGETDWNAQGLSQGNTDIPLNAVGLAQARSAASTLAGNRRHRHASSPRRWSAPGSPRRSPAEALGLPVALDDGLREVAFGVQEGQPMGDWFDDWIAGTLHAGRRRDFRRAA